VQDIPRPAVRRDERRRVQTRQEPPPLLTGRAPRQLGAHGQELLETLRRVDILRRLRNDI